MFEYMEFEDKKYESEEELRMTYHRVLGEIEAEQDKLEVECKNFRRDRADYDEMFSRMHYFYKEIGEYLDERCFAEAMAVQEEEFWGQRRRMEAELDEREEEFEEKRRSIYAKEEELQEAYDRKLQAFH